jgi:hypothetical protein
MSPLTPEKEREGKKKITKQKENAYAYMLSQYLKIKKWNKENANFHAFPWPILHYKSSI